MQLIIRDLIYRSPLNKYGKSYCDICYSFIFVVKKYKKLLAVCPVFDKFCIFVGNYE